MQRASTKHRALGRSIAELDAREPSHRDLLPPANSVPVVGPLVSSLTNGGGGSPPSTSPNPQPAPAPAPGSGGSDGDGGGGGGGGGSTPTPTASPINRGGTAVPPESTVSSPVSPTSASGNPSNPSSASHASSSGSTASSSGSGGNGNFLGNNGGQSPQVNAGSVSSTATSAALGTSTPAMLAMGFSSSAQYSLGSGSNTVGAASPTITTSTAVSSGKQLSGGAIAGITIVCLFSLLALILLVVRRRSIAGRVELRRQWWFGHYGSGGNFSLVNSGSPVASNGEAPASRLSARSSFATNFDHGLMLRVDSPSRFSLGAVPEFPPMAEVRERNSVLISTGGAIARRESMNSMLSNGSEPDAQYLTVSGQDNLETRTPMSVRPFSPSESFVFPKPPAPPLSTADSFFFSGAQGPGSPRSSATLVHISTPSRAFTTDRPPASVSTPSLYPQTSTSSVSFSPFTAEPKPSVDPFADPERPGFADVEVIRRPFQPSLDDELTVSLGDRVRLLQIFDDGWAFIEKLAGTEGERHEQGLIPVDCLREASQALPTFLTEKRVSYGSEQFIATAL